MSLVARIQSRFIATPSSPKQLFSNSASNRQIKLHKAAPELIANRKYHIRSNESTAETAMPQADRIALSRAKHRSSELTAAQMQYNGRVESLRIIDQKIASLHREHQQARGLYERNPVKNAHLLQVSIDSAGDLTRLRQRYEHAAGSFHEARDAYKQKLDDRSLTKNWLSRLVYHKYAAPPRKADSVVSEITHADDLHVSVEPERSSLAPITETPERAAESAPVRSAFEQTRGAFNARRPNPDKTGKANSPTLDALTKLRLLDGREAAQNVG